ncbi:unnamed protein product [Scytosiphon promiscuus]
MAAAAMWEVAKESERGARLVGSRVRIWWDGDRLWYEGTVVSYDSATAKHKLVYDGVDTDEYVEDLESGERQHPLLQQHRFKHRPLHPPPPGLVAFSGQRALACSPRAVADATTICRRHARKRRVYPQAVSLLNDKNGVSLSSIRKCILDKHPETKDKQKASFNNLTIKALMKLVSDGVLEKVKHSFRLSLKFLAEEKIRAKEEKEKEKEKEKGKEKGKDAAHRKTVVGASGAKQQVKQAKVVSRKPPSTAVRRPAAVVGAAGRAAGGSSRGEAAEANRKIRAGLEEAKRRRNRFLSKRRALLLPFLPEGENFFTLMDRALLLEQQEREEKQQRQRERQKREKEKAEADRAAAAKLEAKRAEAAERERIRGGDGARKPTKGKPPVPGVHETPPPQLPPPAAAPREAHPMEGIDFKAIPADPMSVAETLVKMGVLKRNDIAPGAAKVALTGQRCTEWPPLQVDPNNGVPTMEDRDTLGARIDQEGSFRNYFITWPGSRLPTIDVKEVPHVELSYDNVYYLEKREFVTPPTPLPPPEPILGPNGWVYPPQPPPPVNRIIGRTTALRLKSGEFVQHKMGLMKRTQAYAKRSNVPVDNLVTFSIINPHTQRRYNVTREFCAAPCYATIYKRLLRDTVRKNVAGSAGGGVAAAATSALGDTSRGRHSGSGRPPGAPSAPAPVARDPEIVPEPEASDGPPSRSSSPPARNNHHRLPRGPGGIDILSGPAPHSAPMGGTMTDGVVKEEGMDVEQPLAGGEEGEEGKVAEEALEDVDPPDGFKGVSTRCLPVPVGVPCSPHRGSWKGDRRSRNVRSEAWSLLVEGQDLSRARRCRCSRASASRASLLFVATKSSHLDRSIEHERAAAAGIWHVAPATIISMPTPVRPCPSGSMITSTDFFSSRHLPYRDKWSTTRITPQNACEKVSPVDVPVSIKAVLQEHQKEGLRYMAHMHRNGMPLILGDQPGLGKTLQSIALIAHLRETVRMCGPSLVVVPFSVLGDWMSEIAKFCPSLRTVRFHGPKEDRNRIKEEEMKDPAEFDVVVTTHETLPAEGSFFKKRFLWQVVIVDEGQDRLRNDKTQLSQKLKQVNSICRVVITSSPPQSNLHQIWAMLHFLMPDVFTADTAESFEQGFDHATGWCESRRIEQAKELLSVFMLRRIKAEVKLDLPPKQEVKVLVKLSPAQRLVYHHLLVKQDPKMAKAIRAEAQKHKEGGGDVVVGAATGVAGGERGEVQSPSPKRRADAHYRKLTDLLLQLRKACDHPHMLLDVNNACAGETESQAVDNLVTASGKLALLDRMLPRLQERGHRCLIFSQFPSMLEILQDLCLARGYEHVRLDSNSTTTTITTTAAAAAAAAASDVRRRLDVRRFNAPGSKVSIALVELSTAAALTINLASADTVILYDSHWDPRVDTRAIETAHRIGQTKAVKVYRLLCGASVEEEMLARRKDTKPSGARETRDSSGAAAAEGRREARDDGSSRNESGGSVESAELRQAFPASGGFGEPVSKGELASLIHEGARAVVQAQDENYLTDVELDALITTPPTDVDGGGDGDGKRTENDLSPPLCSTTSSSSTSLGAAAAAEAAAAAAAAVASALAAAGRIVSPAASSSSRSCSGAGGAGSKVSGKKRSIDAGAGSPSRPRGLREADLRQLDGRSGGLFGVGMGGGAGLGRRSKKSRVVMIENGDGRDAPGSLAVLTDTVEEDVSMEPCSDGMMRQGHRRWHSMSACLLCRRGPDRSRPLVPCGFCPLSFHSDCLDAFGVTHDPGAATGGTVLVCPQHRCGVCTKTTAAAGGLLFRCQTCPNAFCGNCLAEDQVKSVGRNRQLEALGYTGKQSHWIRCDSCVANGGQPQLTLRTGTGSADALTNERQGSDNPVAHGDSAGGDRDSGADAAAVAAAAEPDGEEDGGSSESESEPEPEPKPQPMPFAVALTLLQDHPAAKAAFLEPSPPPGSPTPSGSGSGGGGGNGAKRPRKAGAVTVDQITTKVEAGRYRSAGAFESDARQMITQGKGPRKLCPEQKEMVAFLERELLPKLRKP